MRASTSTTSLTSLAILLSTLTLTVPVVHAIPPPELLGPDDDPTLNATMIQILTPPKPLTVLPSSDTNDTNSTATATPLIADTGPWAAGCIQVDNLGTGKPASSKHIREGIAYLRGLPGNPVSHQYGCGQVSCSYNSAIFWCDEETDRGLTLNSYADIANGAQAVMDRCGTGSEVMGKAATGWAEGVQPGQQYSVVVTGGTC